MNDNIKIGADIKVHLRGESPWVIVTKIDGQKMKGKINNTLFHEMSEFEQASFMKDNFNTVEHLENLHGLKRGDEIWFELDEYDQWVPDNAS